MTKIKKFTAPSIQEALGRVKREMGDQALILGASRNRGKGRRGKRVEIVAAAGRRKGNVSGQPGASASNKEIVNMRKLDGEIVRELKQIDERLKELLGRVMVTAAPQEPAASGPLSEDLLGAGFDPLLLRGSIDHIAMTADPTPEVLVRNVVGNVAIDGSDARVSVFVGPSGSGKTTTVLKVARAVYLSRKVKPRIVFFGGREARDMQWLKNQCKKLGIKFSRISTTGKLAKLMDPKRKEILLVDTPGISDLSDHELRFLIESSKITGDIKLRLVIDAKMDPWNIGAIASCIPGSPGMSLVLTKLDEATRIGGAVSASLNARLPIAFVTGGSRADDGIYVPDEEILSGKILDGVHALAAR